MRIRSRIVAILGLTAFIVPLIGLVGIRAGWWNYEIGFLLLALASLFGALTLVAGITGFVLVFIRRKRLPASNRARIHWMDVVGFFLGLMVFAFVSQLFLNALKHPLLYDISTDLEDLPNFSGTIVELRGGASNSLAFTEQAKRLHRESHPDLDTLEIRDRSNIEIFKTALSIARDMQWEIVTENSEIGRFEAVDTTFWFRFKDDVVVRVREISNGSGSLVDVRSTSRVGVSDVGTNAQRIRRFLEEIERRSH